MNSQQLQRMIDKAHTRVAKMIGQEFNLYRPLSNNEVLSDSNIIRYTKGSFTLSDSYTSTSSWGVPIWTVYTEAEGVEEGDFLHSPSDNRTYFVLSRKPHLPILAIEAPHRFTISKVEFGTTFEPTLGTPIARNLPGLYTMGASGFGGGVPGRNNASTGLRNMQIITTFPHPENLINSVVTDGNGFQGNIISYEISPIGAAIRLTAQEMERR